MANKEHLAILRQGVKVWNEWRENNFEEIPDLKAANLQGANLQGVNFYQADLWGVHLNQADLSEAILQEAILRRAFLSQANLTKAVLDDANLQGANLEKTILIEAQLVRADIRWVVFRKANLTKANLEDANINASDFSQANFSQTNLFRVQALGTKFDSVIFTGTCIEDWNINSETNLNDVICDYVYLKEDEQERRPSDPKKNFAPGEFTKLFQKALETVDLIFNNGIDWQIFLTSFQQLQVESSDSQLSVQAIEKKPDGAFVIRVEVPDDADKATIEASFWQKYQLLLEAKDEQIAFYRQEIDVKRQENTKLLGIIETMADKENMSLNEYQINILQAIDEGISSGEKIANILKLEKHLVRYHLQHLEKNEFIKCAKGFDWTGEKEYVACRLTDKGKVAAENPSNLIKESIMGGNRTVNTNTYYEQTGNLGIGHMSGGEIKGGAKIAGVINEPERQNLAEAAAEIQQLLEQLSQTYPTETLSQKAVVAEEAIKQIENNPTFKERVVSAIKAMGVEALVEAIDHPVANVLRAGIEAFKEPN